MTIHVTWVLIGFAAVPIGCLLLWAGIAFVRFLKGIK